MDRVIYTCLCLSSQCSNTYMPQNVEKCAWDGITQAVALRLQYTTKFAPSNQNTSDVSNMLFTVGLFVCVRPFYLNNIFQIHDDVPGIFRTTVTFLLAGSGTDQDSGPHAACSSTGIGTLLLVVMLCRRSFWPVIPVESKTVLVSQVLSVEHLHLRPNVAI